MARKQTNSMFNATASKAGSGPTRQAGHIDSIMGGQYPHGLATIKRNRTNGTGSKRRK